MTDALLYPGRINALNGESGGGKSWVATQACVETMRQGGNVLYLDLEDHPDSMVARLRMLAASDDEIRNQFHYIRPDRAAQEKDLARIDRWIDQLDIHMLVIDSIGELMALEGCRPNDDDDVASLYRRIPRRFARLGPTVILIDHIPKTNDHAPLYGIGSQRKRAAIDGASYMVEVVKPFAAGQDGMLKLTTAKDRGGHYAVGSVAAEINVLSQADGNRLVLDVRGPQLGSTGRIRQTHNMERVSKFIHDQPAHSANRNQIEKGSGVSKGHIGDVLADLVAEGWLDRTVGGPGKADTYTVVRLFRDTSTP